MEQIKKTASAKVIKVDDADGIVYGYAVICKENGDDYFDLQGDHIPEAVMRASASEFMAGSRDIKEMHSGITKGQILHSMPITTDLADALGLDIEKTGWLVGMRPDDDAILEKFKSGELTGFSIGGTGVRENAA